MAELSDYIANPFPPFHYDGLEVDEAVASFADEEFVSFWEKMVQDGRTGRSSLAEFMPEIAQMDENISGELTIHIIGTPCGRIPAICCRGRELFESVVINVVFKGRQRPIPPTMGACLAKDYINRYRALSMFGAVARDTIIIASDSPYSGLKFNFTEFDEQTWGDISLRIRLGHEGMHYFTQRLLGTSGNRIHDEVVADYAGITMARGLFDDDIFKDCLGLRNDGRVGRLANYVRDLDPDSSEYGELKSFLSGVSDNIAIFDEQVTQLNDRLMNSDSGRYRKMTSLCREYFRVYLPGLAICQTALDTIGSEGGAEHLIDKFEKLCT